MRALVLLLLIFNAPNLLSQDNTSTDLPPKKSYATQLISTTAPPEIDGKLDDPAWETVAWGGDFILRQPEYGPVPKAKTSFKILYDAKNLYIAFRCFDDEPDKIEKRMGRRDGFEGDWVEINIDSYHDLRTAFSFTTTAAGVKGDELISNNGNNWDGNWNPIWYTKTNIDDEGWTVETRIPLSQLRFRNADIQTWGIQMTRRDFRNAERSVWQPIPQNAGVWVSAFGEMTDLRGLRPQKLIEIQPYVLGQADVYQAEAGNPFADGFDTKATIGLDGKIGLTNDLTLDFTINPDFGQVEADPSAVNLNGFRIFFNEQRPFFIENRNIFDYQLTGSAAGGNYDSDQLFYSRRIGGQPRGRVITGDSIYTDYPQAARILGAAKFSGKTQKGLSIGILEGITAQESAVQDIKGERSETVVEPFTSYFVGRLQQDFNGGNTVVGGIFTATNRKLEGTGLDDVVKSAYSGGVDFLHQWDNQRWQISGKALFSNLQGSRESITSVQQSFEHYFQRPDAHHLSVDTTATTMTGSGATLKIAKFGGQWKFETGLTYRSPDLELNDIGFLVNSDEINQFFWGGYRTEKPVSIFRSAGVNINMWNRWDFGGNFLHNSVNGNFFVQFKNFWTFNSGINQEIHDINNNALFGGPALRRPVGTAHFVGLGSDSRKKLSINLNMTNVWSKNDNVQVSSYGMFIRYQPINVFNISISPNYNHFQRKSQYVSLEQFGGEDRYVVASIDQKTISASIRFNYSITPNLSFQYYGQPFIFHVNYGDFKYIDDPLGKTLDDRTNLLLGDQIRFEDGNNTFLVDENRDGQLDYDFGRPDFSVIEWRSNFVMRWEYRPGSELFLVWAQGKGNFGDPDNPVWQNFTENIFGNKGNNTFLVKYTYRFLR